MTIRHIYSVISVLLVLQACGSEGGDSLDPEPPTPPPDTTPPAITVFSPETNITSATNQIVVKGNIEEPSAPVIINSEAVEVKDSGDFTALIELSVGENTISITSTDAANNTTEIALIVNFLPDQTVTVISQEAGAFDNATDVVNFNNEVKLYAKPEAYSGLALLEKVDIAALLQSVVGAEELILHPARPPMRLSLESMPLDPIAVGFELEETITLDGINYIPSLVTLKLGDYDNNILAEVEDLNGIRCGDTGDASICLLLSPTHFFETDPFTDEQAAAMYIIPVLEEVIEDSKNQTSIDSKSLINELSGSDETPYDWRIWRAELPEEPFRYVDGKYEITFDLIFEPNDYLTFDSPLPSIPFFVTSAYGQRLPPAPTASSEHLGLDLRAPIGTPVYSIHSGEQLNFTKCTSCTKRNAGNYVFVIRNDGGEDREVRTQYLHLKDNSFTEPGSYSTPRQVAQSGNTGVGSGPHLHLDLILVFKKSSSKKKDQIKIDPLPFLDSSTPYTDLLKTFTSGLRSDLKAYFYLVDPSLQNPFARPLAFQVIDEPTGSDHQTIEFEFDEESLKSALRNNETRSLAVYLVSPRLNFNRTSFPITSLNIIKQQETCGSPDWPIGIWTQEVTIEGSPCNYCETKITVTSPTEAFSEDFVRTDFTIPTGFTKGAPIEIQGRQSSGYISNSIGTLSSDGCTFNVTWTDSNGQGGTAIGNYQE